MELCLTSSFEKEWLIFCMNGDLTFSGTRTFIAAFDKAFETGQNKYVLDCTGLKLISSHALATILKLSGKVKNNDGNLCIICPSGHVGDVLFVLEIAKVIPIYNTTEDFWAAQASV